MTPLLVAAIGDSLTIDHHDYPGEDGGPAEHVDSWARLLHGDCYRIVNLAGGGGSAARFLRGCPAHEPCPEHRPGPWLAPGDLTYGPDVVVVALGAADYYTSTGTAPYLADMLSLRNEIRAQAPRAKLLYVREPDMPATLTHEGVTYPVSRTWSYRQYGDALRTVVERTTFARYLDTGPVFRDPGDWRTGDGIHLNQAGQDRLAGIMDCALTSP